MFIPCLNRHIAVCAAIEIPSFAQRDRDFWHSISIMEPSRKLATRVGLKDVLSLRFDDAENLDIDEGGITFAKREHILEALTFVDERPGAPLLIQCWAGLSRSAALALGIIARGLYLDGCDTFARDAVDHLIQIRPHARPNVLVLRLVLETFLPSEEAEEVTREMVNHPVLLANRFHRSK